MKVCFVRDFSFYFFFVAFLTLIPGKPEKNDKVMFEFATYFISLY